MADMELQPSKLGGILQQADHHLEKFAKLLEEKKPIHESVIEDLADIIKQSDKELRTELQSLKSSKKVEKAYKLDPIVRHVLRTIEAVKNHEKTKVEKANLGNIIEGLWKEIENFELDVKRIDIKDAKVERKGKPELL
jgi:hypothetical protein